LFLTKSVRKR